MFTGIFSLNEFQFECVCVCVTCILSVLFGWTEVHSVLLFAATAEIKKVITNEKKESRKKALSTRFQPSSRMCKVFVLENGIRLRKNFHRKYPTDYSCAFLLLLSSMSIETLLTVYRTKAKCMHTLGCGDGWKKNWKEAKPNQAVPWAKQSKVKPIRIVLVQWAERLLRDRQ